MTSFGTREIAEGQGSAQLVHVRLAIANQSSDAPWSVDPGQLMLTPAGGVAQRPDFMEVDGRQNGSTEIARGQRRVLDVYYKMPGGAPDARALPTFEFSWQVSLGSKAFAERTPFVREPYEDYERSNRQYVAVGVAAPWYWGFYGPPWWGPYGYGYGPRFGFGVGGYYGPGYRGGGRMGGGYSGGGRGGGGRIAPTARGRAR